MKKWRKGLIILLMGLLAGPWQLVNPAGVTATETYSLATREVIERFMYTTGEPIRFQLFDMAGHPDTVIYCVSPYHTGPYAGDPVEYTRADAESIYNNPAFIRGATAIIQHGYPGTRTFGGVLYSASEAQYITNVAIWWLHTHLGLPISKPSHAESVSNGYDALFAAATSLFQIGKQQMVKQPAIGVADAAWQYRDGKLVCETPVTGMHLDRIELVSVPDAVTTSLQDGVLRMETADWSYLSQDAEVGLAGYSLYGNDNLFWVVPDDPGYQSMTAFRNESLFAVHKLFSPAAVTGNITVEKIDQDSVLIEELPTVFQLLDGETGLPVGFSQSGDGAYVFSGDVVDLVTSEGVLNLTGIPAASHNWVLHEAAAPEGYRKLASNLTLPTIFVHTTIKIRNVYEMVQLTIIKSEPETEENGSFGGTRFEVWHQDYDHFDQTPDDYRTIVDIPDGEDRVQTGLLRGGENPAFYVREIRAAEGYVPDSDTHSVVFDDPDSPYMADIVIENRKIRGSVSLIKRGEELRMEREPVLMPLAEIPFVIRSAQSGEVIEDLITDDQGRAVSMQLEYGCYTLEERSGSGNDGYTLSEPVPFCIANDGEVLDITLDNLAQRSTLTIQKTCSDAESERLLEGAVFQIMDSEGQVIELEDPNSTGSYLDRFVTDENGTITLPDSLVKGIYSIMEVQPPAGYTRNTTPFVATVDGSGTPVYLQIPNIQTGLVIEKTGLTAETGLAGAVFELEDEAGRTLLFASDENGTYRLSETGERSLITDEEGRISVAGLPIGSYRLTETQAPDGFLLTDDRTVDFVIGEFHNIHAPQHIRLTNKPIPVQLQPEPIPEAPQALTPTPTPVSPPADAPPIPDTGEDQDASVWLACALFGVMGLLQIIRRKHHKVTSV